MNKFAIECIWSIKNEIAVDEEVYRLYNCFPDDYACIPRPSKWVSRFSKGNSVIKCLLGLFRFFWQHGLGVIYSLIECLMFLKEWSKQPKEFVAPEGDVSLGFSLRAYEVIPRAIKKTSLCWITFPWVQAKECSKEKRICFLRFLNREDFIKALALAIRVQAKMAKDNVLKKNIVQSYTAFRWLLVRIALEKIKESNFITAEHFDRWAVLADRLGHLTLVQHGVVTGLVQNSEFPYRLAYKLKNVSRLYVFNLESDKIFEKFILRKCPLEIKHFSLGLMLQEVGDDRLKILVVGHTLCEDFHVMLFGALTKNSKISVYYKPHPLSLASDKIRKIDWKIILDKDYFPRVDVLVSYPSTLVDEYAACGVPAAVHSLGAKSNDVSEVRHELEALIEKIKN